MTEELRQIAASIKSFTPGEFIIATIENTHKVFNTVSNKYEDALMKTLEGYDLSRFLNTIKASSSKNKVKFYLMRTSDVMLGFYTSFSDSMIEKTELYKTTYKHVEGKSIIDKSEVLPLKIKNSYCKLDFIWLAYENYNCDFKIVIHLKKQLPKSNGVVIATDELFAKDSFRSKQYDEENIRSAAAISDIPVQNWICTSD